MSLLDNLIVLIAAALFLFMS